jgi:hypothetical protein
MDEKTYHKLYRLHRLDQLDAKLEDGATIDDEIRVNELKELDKQLTELEDELFKLTGEKY